MDLIADTLMIAGTLGAAFYCLLLSRRLKRFTDLEKGIGGAVAVLSAQVDDLSKTLTSASSSAATSETSLRALTGQAESMAVRLELLLASMHDLEDQADHAGSEAPQADAQETGGTAGTLFQSHRGKIRSAAE